MKDLRSSGVGASSKHTEGISREEEELLWSTNTLNISTPTGLLHAVFFYNRKNFSLRGGQEHRFLKLSQMERFMILKDSNIQRIILKIGKEGYH